MNATKLLRFSGWLLTVCFILATFPPRSFDQVIFVDGLAYAAIARNMAEGLGSFWQPYFADSFWLSFNDRCPFFCDQPPLIFGIESVLYKLLGDTLLVDVMYNFTVLTGSVLLISAIWRLLFRHDSAIFAHSWLPVLFWYAFQIVWWSVPNHLLDSAMAVFCLWSCYFQLKALTGEGKPVINAVLGGLMIFLACLTKGPVGLFPLAVPAIYFMVFGKEYRTKALVTTLLAGATLTVSLAALLMYEPARIFLDGYFHGQIVQALMQRRERVADDWTAHLYMARLVLKNAVPHAFVTVVLLIWARFNGGSSGVSGPTRKNALVVCLVALSAILPMLVSVKQSDYYLMPAFPFVAFTFAAICVEPWIALTSRFNLISRLVLPAAAFLCIAGMMYQLAHPTEDRMYQVSQQLKKHLKPRSGIYLENEIANFSEMQTPLQRYAKLSVAYDIHQTPYLYFDHSCAKRDSVQKTGHFQMLDLGQGAALFVRNEIKK